VESRTGLSKRQGQSATQETESTSSRANTLIVGVFIFFVSTKVLYWLPSDLFGDGLYYWVYTDWLIDYSAGFTRRGLSGNLLTFASPLVHPHTLATIFSWVIFVVVVLGYLRLCMRSIDRLSPLCLVAMLFLPSLLLFYIYDHGALGRKETIGYLILLLHLLLLEKHHRQYTNKNEASLQSYYLRASAILTILLLPIHVFIHEASFLLFVPVHILITWSMLSLYSSRELRKKLTYAVLLYLPVIISFTLVCLFGRPSFEVAHGICEKWEVVHALPGGSCQVSSDNHMWTLAGALTALPWTLSQAHSLVQSLRVHEILAWVFVFSILGLLTLFFCGITAQIIIPVRTPDSDTGLKYHPSFMSLKYFFLPLFLSLPVYILAPDFGRWFAVSCVNYSMISLSKEINYMEYTLAKAYHGRTLTLVDKCKLWRIPCHKSRIRIGYIPGLLILLFVIFYIRLPHCCIRSAFLAEPLRSLVRNTLSHVDPFPRQ
jgi:hypothetical protein